MLDSKCRWIGPTQNRPPVPRACSHPSTNFPLHSAILIILLGSGTCVTSWPAYQETSPHNLTIIAAVEWTYPRSRPVKKKLGYPRCVVARTILWGTLHSDSQDTQGSPCLRPATIFIFTWFLILPARR